MTIQLGARFQSSSTRIEVESRRLIAEDIRTSPCERVRHAFTVNVRAQEGQQNDHGIDKGSPGLTLTFTGEAPSVSAIGIAPAPPERQRLFLFGDSTVTDQEDPPYTGWGQHVPIHFSRGISVVNHSGSGEPTSSFLADPRMWAAVSAQLRPRDVALIQLAHNDKEIRAADYRANLSSLVDGVRAQAAQPVLVTPIVRHRFDRDGQLTDVALIATAAAGDLPQHIRDIAAEKNVPLIDLTDRSAQRLEELGPTRTETLYLIRENGDRTHTSERGATVYAGFVADELQRTGLIPEQYWNETAR